MKKIKLIVLSLLTIALLVACGKSNNNDKNTDNSAEAKGAVSQIKEKGVLVLGTSADFPPMEWIKIDGANQEIVGIDIEIAKAVADHLGVELEIKNMSFEGLINALNVDEVDLVISGMAATPERKEAVDFSKEYHGEGQVLLVKKGQENAYKSIEDLKDKKVGVQLGSVQQQYAEKEFAANIVSMENNNNLIMELQNNNLDCLFLSELPATQFSLVHPELVVVKNIGIPDEDGNAVAIKKGNTDLVKEVNTVIDEIKSSGKMEKWYDEYVKLSMEEVENK